MTDTLETPAPVDDPIERPDGAPNIPSTGEVAQAITDATLDLLLGKPRRTTSFNVTLPDGENTRVVRMKYQALAPTEYDELLAAHPPTTKQRAEGSSYNTDTFPPALIAACSVVPKLTLEQAKELYASPNWAPGETSELFFRAMSVCTRGLDVPFNDGV